MAKKSAPEHGPGPDRLQLILSFDVEEHHRIEAARGLAIQPGLQAHYAERTALATHWILDELGQRGIQATFFIVGDIAVSNPTLVQAIHRNGHEVASHGWNHCRLHHLTPETFRQDLQRSKDALEQVTGEAVVGYRAPTFSIVRQTGWALDVLAELGLLYDSSIYPVWHDRYGVPDAPRMPFRARGPKREILELPLATWRLGRQNIPTAGGGSFRLFPLALLNRGLEQIRRKCRPSVAMLYFHPWEFDPDQAQLPLGYFSRLRTYFGISRSRRRLVALLDRHQFSRADAVARSLALQFPSLRSYAVSGS
jgi:polysaccharide deacetylase family protein (PEP-CTERM system associated)